MSADETVGPGGRAATEAALEEAAVNLLQRDGVLAGLNLREVADEAGVNRGLVYHYFGSRGKLLRQALRHRGEKALQEIRALEDLPFAERQIRFLRTMLDNPEPVTLRTLLLLDRTERFKMMPLRDRTQSGMRAAVQAEEIDPDIDLNALHTLLVTSVYGYVLYREAFAAELGVEVDVLDERFSELYGRVMANLAPAQGQSNSPRRSAVPTRK